VTTLHDEIDALAQIDSEHPGGGLVREVYTAEYDRAVEFVSGLMRDAGLQTRLDAAGNLYGEWTGTEPDQPRVLTGSHVDTTLNAGRYDGVLGVLGAIEAVRRLRADGHLPRRTIELVGIAGEEPRFGSGCIGSRAMTGTITRDELDRMRDRDGARGGAGGGAPPPPPPATATWTPTSSTRRSSTLRRFTASSSCTSSRARCLRRPAPRSGSSSGSPRPMTCG
jgi:hypothetical protein